MPPAGDTNMPPAHTGEGAAANFGHWNPTCPQTSAQPRHHQTTNTPPLRCRRGPLIVCTIFDCGSHLYPRLGSSRTSELPRSRAAFDDSAHLSGCDNPTACSLPPTVAGCSAICACADVDVTHGSGDIHARADPTIPGGDTASHSTDPSFCTSVSGIKH